MAPAPIRDPRYMVHCGRISRPGLQWLQLLSGLGLGACLADDMGLGKTIQVLAHVVERMVVERATMDGTSVQIQIAQDPGQAGKGQAQNYLRLLGRYSVTATPVTGDKMARALTWAGKAGGGMVLLVDGDWNKPFLDELTSFPTGAHDDQVDAVSSAFDKLLNNTFGLIDYYEQQLRAKGIDPATIKTPLQRLEDAAAETARKASEAVEADLEGYARAMGIKPR
jgi:predicted phage terminase large subunit-like protein